MTAAVLSLTERIAELATRYAQDPLPVLDLEARELLAGNHRGLRAWADYTNAIWALGELEVTNNPWEYLPTEDASLYLELAEATATAYWLREKADAFDALVMAASLNGQAQ